MPRYFFDTANGCRFHDTDGMELADADEARVHGIKFAGECVADEAARLAQGEDFRVEVRNSDGLLLFAVTMFVTESPAISQQADARLRSRNPM